jgi:hypothetical protein
MGKVKRSFATGKTTPSLMDRQAREASSQAYGDSIVTNVLSVDEDGNPQGNRRERRMAAQQLRKGKR